jgi:hypothetical protein
MAFFPIQMESLVLQVRLKDDSEHTVTIEKTAIVQDFLNAINDLIPNQSFKYVEISNSTEVLFPNDPISDTYDPSNVYFVRSFPRFSSLTPSEIAQIPLLFDQDVNTALKYCETLLYSLNTEDFSTFLSNESTGLNGRCAKSFTDRFITFHCFECALTPDSVVCLSCFLKGGHESHQCVVRKGGDCCCGNFLKWKDCKCCPHKIESRPCDSEVLATLFSMILSNGLKNNSQNWEKLINWFLKILKTNDLYRRILVARIVADVTILPAMLAVIVSPENQWLDIACEFFGLLLEVEEFPDFNEKLAAAVVSLFSPEGHHQDIIDICFNALTKPNPPGFTNFIRLLFRVFRPFYGISGYWDILEKHIKQFEILAESSEPAIIENCAYEEIGNLFVWIMESTNETIDENVNAMLINQINECESAGVSITDGKTRPRLILAQKLIIGYLTVCLKHYHYKEFPALLGTFGDTFDFDQPGLNIPTIPLCMNFHIMFGSSVDSDVDDFGDSPDRALVYPAHFFVNFYLFLLTKTPTRPWVMETFSAWKKAGFVSSIIPPLFKTIQRAFAVLDPEVAVIRLAHIFNMFLETISDELFAATSLSFWFFIAVIMMENGDFDVLRDSVELMLAVKPMQFKEIIQKTKDEGLSQDESRIRDVLDAVCQDQTHSKDTSQLLRSAKWIENGIIWIDLFHPYLDIAIVSEALSQPLSIGNAPIDHTFRAFLHEPNSFDSPALLVFAYFTLLKHSVTTLPHASATIRIICEILQVMPSFQEHQIVEQVALRPCKVHSLTAFIAKANEMPLHIFIAVPFILTFLKPWTIGKHSLLDLLRSSNKFGVFCASIISPEIIVPAPPPPRISPDRSIVVRSSVDRKKAIRESFNRSDLMDSAPLPRHPCRDCREDSPGRCHCVYLYPHFYLEGRVALRACTCSLVHPKCIQDENSEFCIDKSHARNAFLPFFRHNETEIVEENISAFLSSLSKFGGCGIETVGGLLLDQILLIELSERRSPDDIELMISNSGFRKVMK